MQVIWSPTALREVARIFDYLRDFNPRAASDVAAGLIEAGDSLALFPHRGRPVAKGDLRELVTTYPYIIRYRIGRDAVRILRVRVGRSRGRSRRAQEGHAAICAP